MSEIGNSMDLYINPSVSNRTLSQLLESTPKSQTEQVDSFEKIFDDIAEQFEQTLNKKTEPENKVTSNIEDNKSENNFLSLLGNNFGPPPGLNIEGFNYSLIQ